MIVVLMSVILLVLLVLRALRCDRSAVGDAEFAVAVADAANALGDVVGDAACLVSLMSCGVRVHAVGRASVGATGVGHALVNAMQGHVYGVRRNAVPGGL